MRPSQSQKSIRPSYHHGDLRQTLLRSAKQLIAEAGIENLSLRRLAERAGVSRTAPYHHFSDKNDLLCAIAAEGFRRRHQTAAAEFDNKAKSMLEKFHVYMNSYVQFAVDNPEEYELMFGRSIWKQQNSTEELRAVAYPCFQHQVDMIRCWQNCGVISGDNALRSAQVIWGALHGIAKLFIDGIYTDTAKIEEVTQCAIDMFIAKTI
ncbi:TetR/AcrR family transcriptional regulator [Porticoccaceae bacterium]|nr:TetR/AcrR family transcriptional regulator [Porticoccaceae bacterium]MDB9949392.1 TetR/AcrR family transcriptional regulator [Porticoccaceae bacterium]MDB9969840.1 TetR/AcrR family transcriptional regulator [Porticoccaceae bacterium]MDB9992862.1 TetR/AcrR family transcriptional regulator [Porticoccaceae bacterium]MDC1454009.1 TetR/AcrR family transcriptional regulator [Porticoccaceae bacterium]